MKYVSVAQALGQWLVSVENEVPQTFGSRARAVVAAHDVAKRVHQQSGTPCAVRALLANGEWSVLARFDRPATVISESPDLASDHAIQAVLRATASRCSWSTTTKPRRARSRRRRSRT